MTRNRTTTNMNLTNTVVAIGSFVLALTTALVAGAVGYGQLKTQIEVVRSDISELKTGMQIVQATSSKNAVDLSRVLNDLDWVKKSMKLGDQRIRPSDDLVLNNTK